MRPHARARAARAHGLAAVPDACRARGPVEDARGRGRVRRRAALERGVPLCGRAPTPRPARRACARARASFAPSTSGMDECHHVYEGGCGQIEGALMLGLKPVGRARCKTPRSREYNAHVIARASVRPDRRRRAARAWLSPTHEANHTRRSARSARACGRAGGGLLEPGRALLVEKTSASAATCAARAGLRALRAGALGPRS